MSVWADNTDILATINDSSCYRNGCTDTIMDNYDYLATTDDTSCYRLGCMYVSMMNYDADATIEDGSCDGEINFVEYNIDSAEVVLQASHETEIDSLIDAHQLEVSLLNGEIYSLEAQIELLEIELSNANDSIEVLNNNVYSNLDSISSLNILISSLLNQIEVLSLSITNLEDEIDQLIIDHNAYIEFLNQQHAVVVQNLHDQIITFDTLLFVYLDSIGDLNNEIISLEADLAEEINVNNSNQVEIEYLNNEIDQLDSILTANSDSLISTHFDLVNCEISLGNAEDSIDVMWSNINSLESALSQEQDDHTATEILLNTALLDLSVTSQELVEAYIEINGLEVELSLCQANLNIKDSQIDSLNNVIIDLQLNTDSLEDVIVSMQAEINSLDFELIELMLLITDLNYQIDSLNQVIDQSPIDSLTLELVTANDSIITLNTEVEDLDNLLDDCQENPALVPIEINLLAGWNNIGFTLPVPQDMVATLDDISDDIQIVKNNAGQTYWPEFGFNGIGDFIPGQGYQLRMTNSIINYTFPQVDNRISLTPSVPQWAIDMEVEIHPNDIRTLVRVINMFGQEVNPKIESKGEVLLFMYNDGTVEKKTNY
jgi:chromosome segregation ATPase